MMVLFKKKYNNSQIYKHNICQYLIKGENFKTIVRWIKASLKKYIHNSFPNSRHFSMVSFSIFLSWN